MAQMNRLKPNIFIAFLNACLIFVILPTCSGYLTKADFLYEPTLTGKYFYNNYVGIVMNIDQVYSHYNHTFFQGYFINSNISMNKYNIIPITLRFPKGWFWQCQNAGYLANDTTHCIKQLKPNTTFFEQLGYFTRNTMNSPYWTLGVNGQKLLLANSTVRTSIKNFFLKVYASNNNKRFVIQMMYEGNKAVQNGMRTGTYNSSTFITQSFYYQEILFTYHYKAPGITEDADISWLQNIPDFYDQVWYGIYTFESVIFTDPTLATIQNLLSDNYTNGYFKRRTKVNSTFSFEFTDYPASISKVRLVYGEGIDGITNTLAAAFWWVDFIMESVLYSFYDVSIEGATRSTNFQSAFGPAPDFRPTSLYYASLFVILAGQLTPEIVIPKLTAGTSQKIKIWGIKATAQRSKYLIINKDTNPQLNGTVIISVQSNTDTQMSCIYMQGPSLTSKADTITIGGHYFIGGDPKIKGNFSRALYNYEPTIEGYQVNIKYAQAALCQISTATKGIQKVNGCSWQLDLNLCLKISLLVLSAFLY